MKRRLLLRALFFFILCFPSFAFSSTNKDVVHVAVSILPQKYFVEKIGAKEVSVTVMVPPGANPATYEPRPAQMEALTTASLYFAIGVPFEKIWLKRFLGLNANLRIVNTQDGIKLYPISHYHKHRHSYKCNDQLLDPHVWLAPHLVAIQARNIFIALVKEAPEKKEVFEKNYKAFLKELAQLDLEIMNILMPCTKKKAAFMVFHPSWGYFARAYGLKQISIEEEGKAPRPSHLVELIHLAKEMKIKAIFIQPQFSKRHAEVISKALGIKIIEADPLSYNWSENLKTVAKKMGFYLR